MSFFKMYKWISFEEGSVVRYGYDWKHGAYSHCRMKYYSATASVWWRIFCVQNHQILSPTFIVNCQLLLFIIINLKMTVWVLNLLPVNVVRWLSVEANFSVVEVSVRLLLFQLVFTAEHALRHIWFGISLFRKRQQENLLNTKTWNWWDTTHCCWCWDETEREREGGRESLESWRVLSTYAWAEIVKLSHAIKPMRSPVNTNEGSFRLKIWCSRGNRKLFWIRKWLNIIVKMTE